MWPLPVTTISEKDAAWRHAGRRRAGGAPPDDAPNRKEHHSDPRRYRAERSRGGRTADPGRHGRRRFHGPGPHEPDRQQRARACGWSAVSNRNAGAGGHVFRYAGSSPIRVDDQATLDDADPLGSAGVDRRPVAHLPVASTWTSSARSRVPWSSVRRSLLEAFEHGKDVVLMNAEIDATIGPILSVYAERHGVILSACDGDEPGVQMNLYRWVKGLGPDAPRDRQREGPAGPVPEPDDAEGLRRAVGTERRRWSRRSPTGRRSRFEQSIVANATGFTVLQRGMSRGLEYRGDVMEIGELYDVDELRELGGVVDYVVGTPLTKVYCLAEHDDPKQQHYLELYKLGEGPALLVLHPLPPRPLRGADLRSRASSSSATRCRQAARRPGGGGVRGRQARPGGRRDPRRRTACT